MEKYIFEFLYDINDIILNGRSYSDTQGQYTFISKCSKSTIDYFAVSYSILPEEIDLKVNTSIYSNHQPLELYIEL